MTLVKKPHNTGCVPTCIDLKRNNFSRFCKLTEGPEHCFGFQIKSFKRDKKTHKVLRSLIDVFLVNNHLLIAGTSAGLPAWKKVAAPLMLWANQAMLVCQPYTEQRRTSRRHLYARGIMYILSFIWTSCILLLRTS